MSDYLDKYIAAAKRGEANELFGKDSPEPTEQFVPESVPFPDGFEAVEAAEARPILGNVVGIGAELGTGLYLTKKFHKSQRFLKWANKAKTAAVVGMATPEPASTVGGVLTLAATEAAIWGTSNLIGQNIRKAYGVQDNVSAGEVLASSVFGVGLMTKAGQKFISLGDGLASMKAWGKGNELFVAGTKSFVSGATLGVAETALRQEVQIMLNERENRDVVEYLIGGAAGGGFNTMFDVFSRTGTWGQAKAKSVTAKAKESLAKKADELEARAKTLPARSRGKLLKEARQIRQAIEVTDDLGQQLDTASEALNKPKPKQEEASEAPATPKDTPETTPAPKTRQELTLEEVDSFEVKTPKPEEAETGKPWSGKVVKGIRDKAERTDAGDYGKGDYWSGDTSRAKAYAKPVVGEEGTVGKVIADDVSLENPLVFKTTDEAKAYRQEVIGDKADPFNPQDEAAAQLIDADLRAKGHDGVVVYDSAGNYTATPEKPFEVVALKGQTKKLEATPAPKTPEAAPEVDSTAPKQPVTPRGERIETLRTSVAGLDSTNMSKQMPRIERDAKAIYRDIYDNIGAQVRKLKDVDDPEARAELLGLVKDLRKVNREVKDVVETTAGRTLQAARKDADKYNWTDTYSLRSQQEDAQLAILEDTLERGGKDVEGFPTAKSEESVETLLEELTEDIEAPKPTTSKVKTESEKPKKKTESKQLTDDQKAEKAKEQLAKKKETLQKRLGELRTRFGDDVARETAASKADAKPKKPKNPEIKDLEDRIKFYERSEAEVDEILKLKRQLGELANREASGDITLQRQATATKPKAPSDTSPEVAELRAKISQTKARMRQRLKELDEGPIKAQKEKTKQEEINFRLQLMTDIENAFYKALDADSAGFVTKSMRWIAQSRQMALINQLPSAFAGVPTGAIALVREVNRGVTNYTAQKFAGNPLAGELAKVDIVESLANFKNLFSKDTRKAVGRTLKENQSATDPRKAGRMDEDIQNMSLPRGEAALVARARRRAEKASKAKESLVQQAGQEGAETVLERMNRIYFLGQSGGVRLIQGIDEGFKRTLALGRVRASARKEAILELSGNQSANGVKYTDADVDALAKQKYESALIDSDGLMVLRANHEYIEEVDLARRELLFAANSDNIDEVVTPYSEKIVQTLKQLAGTDHPFSFAINAIMPYIGVPIRGVAKGGAWLGAPIRVLGMPRGNVVANPYIRKIKEAQLELNALDSVASKRGDSPFDEQGLEAINGLNGAKVELLEKIDRLEARRIQFNSDTLADALMTLELTGLMGAAAWAGNATGSLSFLNDDQKKKMGLVDVKPFKLFGMDYKAIGPAAFPLTVVGDITAFVKIRMEEAQTGITILDEDLSLMDVIVKSVVSMAGDQPLSTGAKQITEILGSDEQRKVAASSMISGYTPVPAQVKKAIQQYNNAGRMVDLKGSSFADRLAYGALGMGISNFKTDYFGYDISDPRGFIQNNIMRQWPDAKKTRDTFDNIVGSDITGIIQSKPEYLRTGVRMKDFVDERGVSMTYRFDQQLKETKIGDKTMHAAVYALITNNLWRAKFDEGPKPDANGELINEGLFELNKLMRKYYDKTKEDILNNIAITSRFINKDDITLKDELERYGNGDFLKTFGQPNLADIIN